MDNIRVINNINAYNNNKYKKKKEGYKMKFSIKKNIILEQLTNVSKAISPRNIIPILNGIKFELNNEGLYLLASDSDLTIKSFIPSDKIDSISVEGSIIIQSKYILEIIKKMPGDVIDFEMIDDLKIDIYAEGSRYTLNCLNTLDYPQIDLSDNDSHINVNAGEIKKMIRQTIFATSTQESRPLLTGLNIKINGNILECIATDSYRLAKKTISLQSPYLESIDIVVPGNNIRELDKIIGDEEKNVEIHIFANKIMFKYEGIIFQSNLLNGTYPNTSNFIPNEFIHIITTDVENFYSSVDRAAVVTQSKEKNIIKMEAIEDRLIVSSSASEIGKSDNTIKVSRNINDEFSISYSARYMMDALKTFEDGEIIIFMNTDSKPIVLKSTTDETLIQLILPIKTY